MPPVTATGNVNYLGGKTETKVQSSNLNAGSGALMVGASDAERGYCDCDCERCFGGGDWRCNEYHHH